MDEPQAFQIQAQWMLDPTSLPATANQMLIQTGAPVDGISIFDGVYLSFGHLNPPIMEEPKSQEEYAAASQMVFPVVPVARLFVSRDRLQQFSDVLANFLANTPPEK
jgi:hypothetical protein